MAAVLAFGHIVRADDPRSERITPVVRVFKECSPAVVNLSTTTIVTVRDPIFRGFQFDELFDLPSRSSQRQVEQHSVGSGFVIHSDGYLVTNAHVVDRAGECKVTFSDGTEMTASQVAIDRQHDLAVLKVDADKPLPHLKLGHSDDLMAGETVIAIGNPLGLQHTVTAGIISALERDLKVANKTAYTGLIQTDASINPGNSGGPLLNVLGELIGINTAIRGDAQNIGFAIPVDRLHDLLPEMLDIQRLRRVQFGIHFDNGDGKGNSGVRVKKVDDGSPAAEAGVKAGDIVTAIEQIPTPDFLEAFSVLHRTRTGKPLKLDILRGKSDRRTLRVALNEVPQSDSAKMMASLFGMSVREMNSQDLQRMALRRPSGLLITKVRPDSPAARQGVEGGDSLTLFGGYPVTSLETLSTLIEQVDHGDTIPMQILRVLPDKMIRADVALKAQ